MRKIISILIVFCCIFQNIQAQKISEADLKEIQSIEDTLMVYSHMIINDSIDENRFASTKLFIPMLVKALKKKNSFEYKFDKLKHVSIQYPQDSTFRVFTLHLFVNNDEYHYFGAIQMNTEDLNLIPLIDRKDQIQDIEQQQTDNENWYGVVYYNVLDFDTPEGKKYLLFGYDGYSFFDRRKIVDVLSIENNKATFGHPVFIKKEKGRIIEEKKRILLEFSARASVKLNYDLIEEAIVYDNLISIGPLGPNEKNSFVPDGSYQGYKLSEEGGYWEHITKMFCDCPRVDGDAPRPSPVLENEDKKDLFGND